MDRLTRGVPKTFLHSKAMEIRTRTLSRCSSIWDGDGLKFCAHGTPLCQEAFQDVLLQALEISHRKSNRRQRRSTPEG